MQKHIRTLTARPPVASLLEHWSNSKSGVLEQAAAIQKIAAPTFHEWQRAAMVEAHFRKVGLHDVLTDDLGNVYGRMPGQEPGRPALLISAHMDTVFPATTALTLRHDDDSKQLFGPGIGDNSLGLAAMLSLCEALPEHSLTPECDIWWVATVGEEGLGDLRGMRHACDRLGDRIGLALILEGIGLGRIFYAGLGVRRLQVLVKGPGGHSWLHAGRPSAVCFSADGGG
jgi:acetylornithine deacetylase/succinyl-diaminopimelate desuccinylase-like protein